MNIIATTAGRNYHEVRAIELIRDATDGLDLHGEPEAETYREKMRMAIGLLTLAISETLELEPSA